MSTEARQHDQEHLDSVCLYAVRALAADQAAGVEAQIAGCPECRKELERLRPIVDAFVAWPADVLRPSASLWDRVARQIAVETGAPPVSPVSHGTDWQWTEAAPGISVKLLATDADKRSVSMLVRLAPRTDYPPHRHAGVEELHLLDGVLIVDDKTLYPGDYIRADAGSEDHRVYSETGCTCVLMTSYLDELF